MKRVVIVTGKQGSGKTVSIDRMIGRLPVSIGTAWRTEFDNLDYLFREINKFNQSDKDVLFCENCCNIEIKDVWFEELGKLEVEHYHCTEENGEYKVRKLSKETAMKDYDILNLSDGDIAEIINNKDTLNLVDQIRAEVKCIAEKKRLANNLLKKAEEEKTKIKVIISELFSL